MINSQIQAPSSICTGYLQFYSNIVYRYEMAVGTTPGGAQIQSFTAIPAGSLYHTIGGLSMTGNTIVSNQYKY
jgi:hypothetical protein